MMRIVPAALLAIAAASSVAHAQDNEKSMAVKGGIQMKGWMGVVDAKEAKAGLTVDSAKFVGMGAGMHATTGPAITYWNPGMKGTGDYTVKATFSEREYMGLGGTHPAVNKAEAKGKPVTQEIALQVKGDKVSCLINGQEVASYPKSDVVGAGKLKSTDGVVGFRMGHNTDAHIAGFAVTKTP